MHFGERYIEADEPVLYFDNVNMSMLSEQSKEIYARGGWLNQPKVIWQDRSEVRFQMSQGVVSQFGLGVLLGAKVAQKGIQKPILMHKVEGPFNIDDDRIIELEHKPVDPLTKKTFIFDYERDAVQQKIYGKYVGEHFNGLETKYQVRLYKDNYPMLTNEEIQRVYPQEIEEEKHFADITRKYVVD